MRRVLVGACLGLLCLSLGCDKFRPPEPVAGPGVTTRWVSNPPRADELVGSLNRNSQVLTSIEAKDAYIKAKQGDEAIDLVSYVACQRGARPGTPPNFRLQCYVVGNSEVDIGSNSQEFWYWIKRAPQPYVFHCSYADYPEVAKRGSMPFPFQPEWVVEALGMAEYSPTAKYEVSTQAKDTFDLVQRTRSPRGNDVVKVVAFHKAPRPGQSPVAAHIVYEGDAKGKLQVVCSAVVEESRAVPTGNGKTAIVPTRVRLSCPREKMEMTIDLGKVQPNAYFDQNRVSDLFTRKTLQNYKSYDLARGLDTPASELRPAGGFNR
jgi:hypothetical protein